MKEYDYKIKVNELIPPEGDARFCAKVAFLREVNNYEDIVVDYDFGEARGRTREEAKEKMLYKVIAWKAESGQ